MRAFCFPVPSSDPLEIKKIYMLALAEKPLLISALERSNAVSRQTKISIFEKNKRKPRINTQVFSLQMTVYLIEPWACMNQKNQRSKEPVQVSDSLHKTEMSTQLWQTNSEVFTKWSCDCFEMIYSLLSHTHAHTHTTAGFSYSLSLASAVDCLLRQLQCHASWTSEAAHPIHFKVQCSSSAHWKLFFTLKLNSSFQKLPPLSPF